MERRMTRTSLVRELWGGEGRGEPWGGEGRGREGKGKRATKKCQRPENDAERRHPLTLRGDTGCDQLTPCPGAISPPIPVGPCVPPAPSPLLATHTDILGAIMKAILGGKMLNTKHSAQMHAIFKTHQDKIDKALK